MKKKTAVVPWMRGRHISKRMVAATIAAALVLQPCFPFVSLAYSNSYGYEYDSYGGGGDYAYDDEGNRVYVTNVTKTYDNGAKYVAEYQYDADKRLIYANIKEADGSKSTISRKYVENLLVSETSYDYSASSKKEVNMLKEYDNRRLVHRSVQSKFSDGTNESEESWYRMDGQPIKAISIDKNGITQQTDYVYNEYDELISGRLVGSDGSKAEAEYQYDESGSIYYYKIYRYDAPTKAEYLEEARYEGEGPSRSIYEMEMETDSDGQSLKKETWKTGEREKITKSVTTNPDGSQITENYTYNSDGDEIRYIMSDSDGMIKQRETTINPNGETQETRDRAGNTKISSFSIDVKTNEKISEDTATYADGSYTYIKRVYSADSYEEKYSIARTRTADGVETYSEMTSEEDGSYVDKTKYGDGRITETTWDANGKRMSRKTTYPNGEVEEGILEKNEDGKLSSTVTRYPDGGEIRVTYEYNEAGERISSTETRQNGISAVTQYQNTNDVRSETVTFSNGCHMTGVRESINDTEVYTYTFSAGEIAQATVTIHGGIVSLKTVYHDGRTEEFSEDYRESGGWESVNAKLKEYHEGFNNLAWEIQPAAAEETSAVTGPGLN